MSASTNLSSFDGLDHTFGLTSTGLFDQISGSVDRIHAMLLSSTKFGGKSAQIQDKVDQALVFATPGQSSTNFGLVRPKVPPKLRARQGSDRVRHLGGVRARSGRVRPIWARAAPDRYSDDRATQGQHDMETRAERSRPRPAGRPVLRMNQPCHCALDVTIQEASNARASAFLVFSPRRPLETHASRSSCALRGGFRQGVRQNMDSQRRIRC